MEIESNNWISLTKYSGLSESKAKFYVGICELASKYVKSHYNIRMVQDE